MREFCPSCQTKWKITEKCHECSRDCCDLCSIDHLCIECYVKINRIAEKEFYFKEKYKSVKT